MKKILLTAALLSVSVLTLNAQSASSDEDFDSFIQSIEKREIVTDTENIDDAINDDSVTDGFVSEEGVDETVSREVIIPEKKRPRKPDEDKILAVEAKNEEHNTNEYLKQCSDTFKYGLEEEINTLIDELTKSEDLRFVDEIYDLFQETKSNTMKQKILAYFTTLKDPCLEDFAVTLIDDPYDENKDTVNACFKYIAAVDCKNAIPCLITLIEKEEEDYFNGALTCIGEIGSADEAVFLSEYLDREDLTTPQKQAFMKVLGRIKAVETWDKLCDIAQNEDENSYVRMYAAQAIGAMEKEESLPILIKLFETNDANLRIYVLKGVNYFKTEEADKLIIQALRDSQYKVRLEAVNCAGERLMTSAVPYLIYRCKDKSEQASVKDAGYKVLAKLNVPEANEYLVNFITDKKTSDTNKAKIASALLEYNYAGSEEIIKLCSEVMTVDSRKNLRYALGKEFAKYGRPEYEEICMKFLESKDVNTQGTGLDIFAKGKYEAVRPKVEELAKEAEEPEEDKTETDTKNKKPQAKKKAPNANAKKAKRILSQIDSYTE